VFDATTARAVSLKGTMRFSIGLLVPCWALATAFVQNSSPLSTQKASVDVDRTKFVRGPFVGDERSLSPVSSSALSMAFDLSDSQMSNMFDGPLPLTKERDACGVGFIANTQSGGKFRSDFCHNFPKFVSRIFLQVELFPCPLLASYILHCSSFEFRGVWYAQSSPARPVCS